MTHHAHGSAAHHGHSASFDDEQYVRRLESEARLASGVHREAARLCHEQLASTGSSVRRVLDLGSGPGVTSVLLADRFPAARVVAVDGSAAMLRRAEALAAGSAAAGRVDTRLLDLDGDLRPLGTAELVWASMSLHHAADELATLREVRGLLSPDGLLCVLERAEPTTVRLATDLGVPGLWDRLTAAWSASAGRRPDSAGRHAELLDAAGYDVVDARTLRDTASATDDEAIGTFVADRLAGTFRALDGLADPADLEVLRAWVDDPRAHTGAATATFSRELLLARVRIPPV